MRAWIAIALMFASPSMAQAQASISNAEFVRRAEPLMKRSMASLMFSSDAKKLMKQLNAAAQATRARQDADRAAGRRPATCLPPKGKAKIDAGELITYLMALPPAEQSRTLQVGFASFTARNYPCPGA